MKAFDYDGAIGINKARIDHFNSLDISVSGKTVLETGCGGRGDITRNLVDSGAKVTLMDAREGNILSLLNMTELSLPYYVWDLNLEPSGYDNFDIVFSYGTLYHVENYSTCIETFHKCCTEMVILETALHPDDNGISFVNGRGDEACAVTDTEPRLGRNVIISEFKKYFNHVYLPSTVPAHPDFISREGTYRFILIASREAIINPLLNEV